jgi:O-antigen/teichoic acid export membrane protein
MQVKFAIFRNMLAGGFGKGSIVLFRLLQVPLLLSALGVEEYGRWLVLASIPSWLALANLGFGSVAATEMSMAVAAGDLPRARGVYSTALALITGIGLSGSCITFLVSPLVPWEKFLSVPIARHSELVMAVNCLSLAVFISFFADTFYGRFQAARKAHQAVWLISGRPWIEFFAMVAVLQFSPRLDLLAAAMLCSSIIFLLLYQWLSRRSMPELTFASSDVQSGRFRLLFKKGIAFQAFPLGNALLFQGSLLIVQYFLGPVAVTLFATARTLCRSVNQSMELVNQAIWPELSRLLGVGDLIRAARLHRIAVLVSVVVALFSFAALAVFGQTLYRWWTDSAIDMPLHVLLLFLLPIPFNALWFTSSVVHAACNQHEGLAIRYMIATGFASATCAVLSYTQGIEGAAIASLVSDLVLIPYVVKRSLALTGDSWSGLALGLKQEIRTTTDSICEYFRIAR